MKKKTMFKAFNALVRASAKEIRWSDGIMNRAERYRREMRLSTITGYC